MKSKKLSKEEQLLKKLGKNVDELLAEEACGKEDAFADWLHTLYLGGLGGEKLSDFNEFIEYPLAGDMIADWKYECSTRDERVELLDHILGLYRADDFDEQEHFDENGNAILVYGEPGDVHYDKDGKPIVPYVLAIQREQS